MADFALVIFETDKNGKKNEGLARRVLFKTGMLKSSLCTRLFLLFKSKYVKAGIKSVVLYEDTNVWIIKLPFTAGRLPCFNSGAIKGFVGRFCTEKGAAGCFMPSGAVTDTAYDGFRIRHDAGQIIYKAHLLQILHDIYEDNGIRLGSIDTVIVAGRDRQELLQIVRRLEPRFKFLTVAASKDAGLEDELAEISEESGLTVNTCYEWKSALKNADLIINLAGAPALSKFRMKSRSFVINYNSEAGSRMQGENVVINGVEFTLPPDVTAGLDEEVLQNFSKKELAEAVAGLRIGRYDGQTLDDAFYDRVLEEFGKCGCRIAGYIGRRGAIKAENIIKARVNA